MMLSEETICKIADALVKDIQDYVYSSEEYSLMIGKLIDEALDAKMGEMDDKLHFELGMILFEKILRN